MLRGSQMGWLASGWMGRSDSGWAGLILDRPDYPGWAGVSLDELGWP